MPITPTLANKAQKDESTDAETPTTVPTTPAEKPDDDKLDSKVVLEKVGEFFLTGEVSDGTHKIGLAMLARAVKRANPNPGRPQLTLEGTTFTLNICTNGGSVSDGFALGAVLNRLRDEFGIRIVTRIHGSAFSMGLVIAQFGDERLCDSFALVHTHDVQSIAWGDTGAHEDYAHYRELLRSRVALLFAARNSAGNNDPQWWLANYLNRGTNHFLSPDQALQLGVIDRVVGLYPPIQAT